MLQVHDVEHPVFFFNRRSFVFCRPVLQAFQWAGTRYDSMQRTLNFLFQLLLLFGSSVACSDSIDPGDPDSKGNFIYEASPADLQNFRRAYAHESLLVRYDCESGSGISVEVPPGRLNSGIGGFLLLEFARGWSDGNFQHELRLRLLEDSGVDRILMGGLTGVLDHRVEPRPGLATLDWHGHFRSGMQIKSSSAGLQLELARGHLIHKQQRGLARYILGNSPGRLKLAGRLCKAMAVYEFVYLPLVNPIAASKAPFWLDYHLGLFHFKKSDTLYIISRGKVSEVLEPLMGPAVTFLIRTDRAFKGDWVGWPHADTLQLEKKASFGANFALQQDGSHSDGAVCQIRMHRRQQYIQYSLARADSILFSLDGSINCGSEFYKLHGLVRKW